MRLHVHVNVSGRTRQLLISLSSKRILYLFISSLYATIRPVLPVCRIYQTVASDGEILTKEELVNSRLEPFGFSLISSPCRHYP